MPLAVASLDSVGSGSNEDSESEASSEASSTEEHPNALRLRAWTLESLPVAVRPTISRGSVRFAVALVYYAVLSLLGVLFARKNWIERSAAAKEGCSLDSEFLIVVLISWLGVLPLLVALWLFASLQRGSTDKSPLMVDVERFLMLASGYLSLLAGSFLSRFACECKPTSSVLLWAHDLDWVLSRVVGLILVFIFTGAIEKRLVFIHKTFGEGSSLRRIRAIRCAMIGSQVCGCAAQVSVRLAALETAEVGLLDFRVIAHIQFLPTVCVGLASLILAVLVAREFTTALSATAGFTTSQTGIYTMAEASWSHWILSGVRNSMVIPLASYGVGLLVKVVVMLTCSHAMVYCLVMVLHRVFVISVESACLLPMFGLGLRQEHHPRLPQASGRALLASAAGTHDQCARGGHTETWRARVHALAGRSISVDALLSFYGRLGSPALMPSYDPWRSTTNDVVRQAIIPSSRNSCGVGGTAYSVACSSRDQAHPAECMVTHTWSSLFVDLVAAVTADALGATEYSDIAEGLASGHHDKLRRKLDAHGALHHTYWICAFCINQHSSICGSFAPEPKERSDAHAQWDAVRRDMVTSEIFTLCDCGEPKFFNDTPDECELNKFDHMMALLHAEVPGFRHLVVVDREFRVFSRVWCVAELVEAYFSQIKQHVQLCSCDGLRDDAEDLELYIRLATLTVASAEASRPEDKDAILARIPSIREFDAQLQAVIFGDHGLLNRCFVGFGVVEAAANTARRLQALQRRSNSVIGLV